MALFASKTYDIHTCTSNDVILNVSVKKGLITEKHTKLKQDFELLRAILHIYGNNLPHDEIFKRK